LADLVVAIEHARFACPKLQELQAKLGTRPRPSAQLRSLNRIADFLDSRENLFLRVFGPPLLWTTQVVFALEQWRARYGPFTRAWVEAVAEIEALSSLGTYAYEHPEDPFPQFVEEERTFAGRDLGHPLVRHCVRNSITLYRGQPLFVVSGSNMSGKSTLLRTIGTNAVLAFAGAPVRAASLEISPLAIGASLHVMDSLAEGESHFSAEIKRIRLIVDLAEKRGPALFLIDEILQGTNSQDRLTGTRAILERLLAHDAVGLITTHDLALTRIEGIAGSSTTNVHFQDEIRGGKMTFDYKLKPGVVRGSNAIELMRLYGLLE
jgi:DNA mismatch repair ATPase MutS